MKEIIGLSAGFFIGAICRYFKLPAPAPPNLAGAMLVVSITLGFILADYLLASSLIQ